jgi:LEM-3-like GIY-YIG domain/NUMOD3 motif
MKARDGFTQTINPKIEHPYYVYEYVDPRNNLPFYIGKGKGNRCFSHLEGARFGFDTGNSLKDRKIKKILSLGLEPKITRFLENLTEEDALRMEEMFIFFHGRKLEGGILTNIAGSGNSSDTISCNPKREQICEKISKSMIERGSSRGSNNPCFGKFGKLHPAFGCKHSRQSIEKRSQKLRDLLREHPRTGDKNPMFGKHQKEISKQKMSETRKRLGSARGSNNPKAKTYQIISPDGEIFTVTGGLKDFCIQHSLKYSQMGAVGRGEKEEWKGWKCKQISF